jgi:hypothetical protein
LLQFRIRGLGLLLATYAGYAFGVGDQKHAFRRGEERKSDQED